MQWRNRIKGLEHIPVSQLMQHAGNWRMHPAGQQEALAGVLDSIGIADTILVYQSERQGGLTIIDGHLRSRMAQDASWPCLVLDVTDQEADLLLATLDPLAAMATRDELALTALLDGLKADDEAVTALLEQTRHPAPGLAGGMPPLARAGEGGDVEVTPLPVKAVPPPAEAIAARLEAIAHLQQHYGTALGQVWQCGRHQLACGDSTDPEAVGLLLAGAMAALVMTSPPYWVGRDYEQERGAPAIRQHIARQAEVLAAVLAPQCHIVLNTGTTTATMQGEAVREVWLLLEWWQEAMRTHDLYMRNVRIWAKEGLTFSSFTPEQDVVGQKWEFLASFTRAKPRAQNRIGEKWALDGVWDCAAISLQHGKGHQAVYPIEIPWRYITLYTDEGDSIYDPYGGAGTTMLAAEATKRRAYSMERDPGYIAITLDRWERTTGQAPERKA